MGLSSKLGLPLLIDRVAAGTDRAIHTVVERRGPAIAATGDRMAAAHPGADPAQLVHTAVNHRSWQLAGTGAVSALPAVMAGPGTVVEIGAALGDVSLLTAAQVELILLAAHLFGRPLTDHDARRLDVLMVLGIDVGVVKLRRGGAVEALGVSYRTDQLRGAAAGGLAATISGRLAIQVTGRLARRRAHVVLGREIPLLGIGLAAGYNMHSTRRLGDTAVRFFRHIA
jgi:uncharacterized protein (DUF697 family)